MRYYLHFDAADMTDDRWAECIAQLAFIRNQEKEASESVGKQWTEL
jgi:hypothetical protein